MKEGTWKLKNGTLVDLQRNDMGEFMALVQAGSYLYYLETGECVKERTKNGTIYLKPSLKSNIGVDGSIQMSGIEASIFGPSFFEPWDLCELIEEKIDKTEAIKRNSNLILSLDLFTE